MNGILKLKTPILVNGSDVCELAYNTENITSAHFCEADAKKRTACGAKNVSVTPAAELDYGLHLYLGFAAIVSTNPSIDFADLERIKGSDVVDVMKIGRNFILKSEVSAQSNSDEQSETTPDTSTQA
jgi:hypothetical protein